MPTISVLMPVYNAERYVAAAVESVLGQTLADFEFIIIDDGSTDRSADILLGFAAQDDRVRLISRGNTGYLVALNEGLQLARGELIARIDADDIAFEQRFEQQAEYLRTHPECVIVGCGLLLIDEEGEPFCESILPAEHEVIDARHLAGIGSLAHPAAMIRRAALLELGGYRPQCYGAEDHDLWLRLAEHGKLANLPDVLMKVRVHAANFTFVNQERTRAAMKLVLAEAHARRGLTPPVIAQEFFMPADALERRRVWAWSAVHAGHYRTARKHACSILRQSPGSRASWVLFVYAILGRRAERLRWLYRKLTGRPR
jgi:glycosyltransferase involved in cell wall biosynthesis